MKKKILISVLVVLLVISLGSPVQLFAVEDVTTSAPELERLSGADRYQTAAEISGKEWTNSQYAVLAAGMNANLVDALAAAPLAKAKNAPILLTAGDKLSAAAETELTRLEVQTVYLTSGSAVIQKPVRDRLAELGIEIISLGGKDRFETSVNIAKELAKTKSFSNVVVTTAYSNADALAVAPIAADQGWPILLAGNNSLPAAVDVYLQSLELSKTYLIGGTGAVKDDVKKQLVNPVRIGGKDRFDTNIKILKTFKQLLDYNSGIYIANGMNNHLVDSLAASCVIAGNPLLLTPDNLNDKALAHIQANPEARKIIILGGTGSVSWMAEGQLTELLTLDKYLQNGVTLGSDQVSTKQNFNNNIVLNADNMILQNAIAEHNVYIKGDNCTIKDVTIRGNLYIDPGKDGSADIDTVSAKEIIVQSGASNSIRLVGTTADNLSVEASEDSQVRVVTGTATTIGNLTVQSYAIVDNQGAQIGIVTIASAPGQTPEVTLSGTFTESVVVEGQANITAAQGAEIPSLEINSEPDAQVGLRGDFANVNINTPTGVFLNDNSSVANMSAKDAADIIVPPSATVGTFSSDSSNTKVYGGGTVNGTATSEDPDDGSSDNNDSTDSSGGSGSSGGGSSPPAQTGSLSYAAAKFIEVPGNNGGINDPLEITLSGDTFTGLLNEDFITANKAMVSNVPAGLTAEVRRKTDTTAWLVLIDSATNHADANDVSNLTITFNNAAFAGGSAASITNYTKNNLTIDFNDPAPAITPILDFALDTKTSNSAAFTWSAASGATSVKVQQMHPGDMIYEDATTGAIAADAGTATVTGLSPSTDYVFRLYVTGGENNGVSNEVTLTTNTGLGAADLITSVTGTSVDEAGDTIVIAFSEGLNQANAENRANWIVKYADDALGTNATAIDTTNADLSYSAGDDELTITLNEEIDQAFIPNKYVSVVPANTNVLNAAGDKYVDNTGVEYTDGAVVQEVGEPGISVDWSKENSTTFKIIYDEVLDRAAVTDANHWTFIDFNNGGTTISDVSLGADGKTITLTISDPIEGYDNFAREPIVSDLVGNPIQLSNYEEDGILISTNEVWQAGIVDGMQGHYEQVLTLGNNYGVQFNDSAGGTDYFAGINITNAGASSYDEALLQSKPTSVADVGNTVNGNLKVFYVTKSGALSLGNLSNLTITPQNDAGASANPVTKLYLEGQRTSGTLIDAVIQLYIKDSENNIEASTYLTIKSSTDDTGAQTGIDIIANPHLSTGNEAASIVGSYSYADADCPVSIEVFDRDGSAITAAQTTLAGRVKIYKGGVDGDLVDPENYTIDDGADTITFYNAYLGPVMGAAGLEQQFFIEYYATEEDYNSDQAFAAQIFNIVNP